MPQGLLEKTLFGLASHLGQRRVRAAARQSRPAKRLDYYAGAANSRLTMDWQSSGMAPDQEIRYSLRQLRDRARDLERNNPAARHYLRLLATNVIGPHGVRMQARVKDNSGSLSTRINDRIEQGWSEWCLDPMLDRSRDFASMSRLLIKNVARDGDVAVRLWRDPDRKLNEFGLALELIDPDLIDESLNREAGTDGNAIRMGVEFDSYGRNVAFHVWNRPQTWGGLERKRDRIPADEIIHLLDADRIGQSRGVTWLASTLMPLKMIGGMNEAELVASRTAASKMGFFQKRQTEGPVGAVEGDENGDFTMEANPGTFGIIPSGYEIAEFSPDHPSSAFAAFLKSQLRDVSMGLGCSYNALANDLEGVNYSSLRGGLIIERDVWSSIQTWWIGLFLRRVYAEWLNMALLTSAVTLDSRDVRKFRAVEWYPRGWAWVDPLNDTQAGVLGIQNGLTSRTELLAEQGKDFETVARNLAAEKALADQLGIDIAIVAAAPAASTGKDPDDDETEDDKAKAKDSGS